ncbi:hypothetical protein [Streptomyces sp. NBC_00009]|uniref:hypothetical protein n=1 Tax=Streptomyces sp. NBC_00009 TaxID=2975620 RepID=UPI00324C616B
MALFDAVEDGQRVDDIAGEGRLLARTVEAAGLVPQFLQVRAVGLRVDVVDPGVRARCAPLLVVDERSGGEQ